MKSITLSCLLGCLFSGVFAQNMNVTPAKINFNLEPGEFYETEIVVRNTATKMQKINIALGDFDLNVEGGSLFSDANSSDFSCASWITLTPSFLELNPNESKKVKVKIKVPENGTTTRWGMIFIEPADEQISVETVDKSLSVGTKVTTRVGIPIFQSPRNSGKIKADIQNLKEVPNDTLRQFVAEIVNEGDKVIEAVLFTVFSNIETGEETEVPTENLTILPKNSRNFRFTLPEKLPKGKYALTVVLDYDADAEQEGVRLNILIE